AATRPSVPAAEVGAGGAEDDGGPAQEAARPGEEVAGRDQRPPRHLRGIPEEAPGGDRGHRPGHLRAARQGAEPPLPPDRAAAGPETGPRHPARQRAGGEGAGADRRPAEEDRRPEPGRDPDAPPDLR